ncbi:uncharacterized protein LOC122008956 [Zingiber officinale]|uniref:Uncharacterized protein n=1 Tax=Zingiber officinale TaxID=94328 RepID=A0A8J5IL37_ZINOF|nr:uncharacterized protein LOC122008956 [Zingiber officinale]KAG6536840.1 hypothetical protein ZIOFF_001911 [Zingiber officinale]
MATSESNDVEFSVNKFHVRSISLPSQTHPATRRVEDELQKLRTWMESSASSMTKEMICNGMRRLGELYDGMEDICHLPGIRQGLLHFEQKKRLQQHADGSIKLLDLFGTIKDAVISMKESVQDLQLAIRRRGENPTEDKVKAYIRSRKALLKMIKKSYKEQVNGKCKPVPEQTELSVILRMLNEACSITVSLLCSITHSTFAPEAKSSWWSFSSKTMRAISRTSYETWNMDVSLFTGVKEAGAEKMVIVQDQLQSIEKSLGDLENGMECLFRRLIQNRVSLLNILSL